jgi:hypothetical protein
VTKKIIIAQKNLIVFEIVLNNVQILWLTNFNRI